MKNRIIWAMTAAVMLVIIAVLVVAFIIFIKKPCLVLYNAETEKIYKKWRLYDGFEFSIEFIHSVNKSPIRTTFGVKEDKIIPLETKYSSFGAGVQTDLTGNEVLNYDDEGNMIISGFDISFDKLPYIVGTVYDHVLTIEGKKISLTELCGRNSPVVFEIRH